MNATWTDRLRTRATRRIGAALGRRLPEISAVRGNHLTIDERQLLSFSSNDYLGLSQHPTVVEHASRALRDFGLGATAAPLVIGRRAPQARLEARLAEWLGYERVLVFANGYGANLGALSALLEAHDICLQDRLNHACLIDGARLAGVELKRYVHGDVESAERMLVERGAEALLIATDGVFSMDGDLAPLPALVQLAQRSGGLLYVDDAHGLGVLGAQGRGTLEHYRLSARDVPVLVGTFGKAFGAAGAFVAASANVIDELVHNARTFVYSTALPPAVLAGAEAALEIVRKERWRRDKLATLVERFRERCTRLGVTLAPSQTPIQPVLIGDSARALAVARGLEQRGLQVTAIRPPTVAAGSARLRVALNANHETHEVDHLADALGELLAAR